MELTKKASALIVETLLKEGHSLTSIMVATALSPSRIKKIKSGEATFSEENMRNLMEKFRDDLTPQGEEELDRKTRAVLKAGKECIEETMKGERDG